ncbi:MAG: hypothetical protein RBT63_03470 [Bdellovibrionales bacterium]|nr:hypothetical protein [Bdellovibrionales bacterium]
MKNVVSVLAISAMTTLGLASCGGGGAGAMNGPAGNIGDAAQMKQIFASAGMGQLLSAFKPDADGMVMPDFDGLPGGVFGVASFAAGPDFSTCVTESGNDADIDVDGIFVNATRKFNCSGIKYNDGTSDVTANFVGSASVLDKDDSKKGLAGGYRYESDLALETTSATDYLLNSWKGFVDASATSTALKYSMELDFSFRHDFFDGGHPNYVTEFAYKFDTEYQPKDMTAPYVEGKFISKGYYKYGGVIEVNGNNMDIALTFEVEANATYDTTCGSYYRDGKFSFSDANGNKFEAVYDACNVTYMFNGQEMTDL